ncbi:MAG: flavin reductase family protein [Gemmatimonadales bacterium]|nr:flavin reductase family protein [Gemmatimonadales bacterium]
MTTTEVGAAQFRQLLGRFATGVTILTVRAPDGQPVGMTANSLASVSLHPPLLSVCVDRQAEMHDLIIAAPEFVVNVLSQNQEALSRRFGAPRQDRFDGVGYTQNPDGLILLEGAIAHIECHRYAEYSGGDHTIVVGRVVGGTTGKGEPLLYYRGGYASLG